MAKSHKIMSKKKKYQIITMSQVLYNQQMRKRKIWEYFNRIQIMPLRQNKLKIISKKDKRSTRKKILIMMSLCNQKLPKKNNLSKKRKKFQVRRKSSLFKLVK